MASASAGWCDLTRSSSSRKQRRLAKSAARATAGAVTPEEARQKLAEWAAAGGDLDHLKRTGKVRQLPGKPHHTTLAEMRDRYNEDGIDLITGNINAGDQGAR